MPGYSAGKTQRLAGLVRGAGSVVALTGAGISVPSGIPDFRTPGTGMWAEVDPMEVAHIEAFQRDPERFWRFYGERFATLEGRRPNGAHLALAEMEGTRALDGVITQNVDMLHRAAGSREVVEMHGTIATCSCPGCGQEIPLSAARSRSSAAHDGVPRCEACAEPVRPDVVLFGEMLPTRAMLRARVMCERADLMICIGTSLEVHPVAGLPLLTLERGGQVAIITQGATPLDDLASVRLQGDVVDELTALRDALQDAGSLSGAAR
jgi:NAD-dependent deacetylase